MEYLEFILITPFSVNIYIRVAMQSTQTENIWLTFACPRLSKMRRCADWT